MRNSLTYTLGEQLRVVTPEIKSFVFQVTEPKGPFFWGLYSVTYIFAGSPPPANCMVAQLCNLYKPTLEDLHADALVQFDRPDLEKNLWEPQTGGVAPLLEEWNPLKYASREEAKAALTPLYQNVTVANLDLKTFVDYFLINELSSNSDAYVYYRGAHARCRDAVAYTTLLLRLHLRTRGQNLRGISLRSGSERSPTT